MQKTFVSTVRFGVVVLAAGKGTRMGREAPKVLTPILEEPLLRYVYDYLAPLLPDRLLTVIGHKADMVRAAFPDQEDGFILQETQLGTGHALMAAWKTVLDTTLDYLFVINGDTPLASSEELADLLRQSVLKGADIAFLTLTPDSPGALGRVLRENGKVRAIIEAKDYDEALHGTGHGEVNSGIYCLKTESITKLLPLLRADNKNNEFYITDLISLGVDNDLCVTTLNRGNSPELLGINTPAELIQAEELMRRRIVQKHLAAGVFVRNPLTACIGPDVVIAAGADISGPCELYGESVVEAGVRIESNCRIVSSRIEKDAHIHAFSHIEKARVGQGAHVGPYARLRPDAVLEDGSRVGNFVEIKKSVIGKKSKVNHLSYVGDAEIGENANVGAGTITCNYDGKTKHKTIIGAGAFIGSNSALVAPVSIGNGSLVGAGSVITKNVPDGHLAVARPPLTLTPKRQKN